MAEAENQTTATLLYRDAPGVRVVPMDNLRILGPDPNGATILEVGIQAARTLSQEMEPVEGRPGLYQPIQSNIERYVEIVARISVTESILRNTIAVLQRHLDKHGDGKDG